MKILAFSDLHRRIALIPELKRKASDVEVVINVGDLSDFGKGLEDTCNHLIGIHKVFLAIPGNNETPMQLEMVCRRCGCMNIHSEMYRHLGYTFAGVGGSTPTPFRTPFELSEEEFERILDRFKGINDLILVSHSPPYGTKTDQLLSGLHVGSKAIRRFIEREHPILVLCGHVHERAGVEDRIGETRIINVGPKGVIIEV